MLSMRMEVVPRMDTVPPRNQYIGIGGRAHSVHHPFRNSVVGNDQTSLGINNINFNPCQPGNHAGPGTGGVDHQFGLNLKFFAGRQILQAGRLDLFIIFHEPDDFGKSQQSTSQGLGLGHIFH